MLRNILIAIGLLVAINPYLGFPQSIDKIILTGLGLFSVFLLILSRRGRIHREVKGEAASDIPKELHVDRRETVDAPNLYVERRTMRDAQLRGTNTVEEVEVEKKTTVVRRRRIKTPDDTVDTTDDKKEFHS